MGDILCTPEQGLPEAEPGPVLQHNALRYVYLPSAACCPPNHCSVYLLCLFSFNLLQPHFLSHPNFSSFSFRVNFGSGLQVLQLMARQRSRLRCRASGRWLAAQAIVRLGRWAPQPWFPPALIVPLRRCLRTNAPTTSRCLRWDLWCTFSLICDLELPLSKSGSVATKLASASNTSQLFLTVVWC